jgi:tetratricopeptide (TPR) repeat protein
MQARSTLCRLFPWLTVLALAGGPTVAAADDLDTCARQSGDAAIAACSRAIASGEFSGEELAKIYLNRGVEHKSKGELDSAIADYSEAIRVAPSRVAAYFNRGNAWIAKGDRDRAIGDYDAALRLDPKYVEAYDNRGDALLARGDLDSAIADYDEAIRLNPKFAKSYYNRGVAREKKRSLQEALSDFEAYAQLVPSDPDGPKSMARVKSELSAMTGRR